MSEMRRRLRAGVWAALAVLLGIGLANAQPSEDSDSDDREPSVDVRRPAVLSAAEQLEEAGKILRRSEEAGRRVSRLLAEARRDGDVIRVTCLNRRLTEIDANLRTVRQRSTDIQTAARVNDDARREHEFTVLSVVGRNMTTLEAQANQCIGQDTFSTGETEVKTLIEDEPLGDPSLIPAPPVDVPVLPSPASPFI